MSRLASDNYKKPEFTLTDMLTEDEIKNKLKNYKRLNTVEELEEVALGTHLRYFDFIDEEYKFRLGGILLNKKGIPDYIVLSNGKKTWCPQVKRCVFFKKMTNKEIKQEYNEIIERQVKEIHDLKNKSGGGKRIVKYKDSDIDGDRLDINDIKDRDFIIAARKRKKRIYDPMFIYNIEKVGNTITEINAIDASFNKFIFDPSDFYFYKIYPDKDSAIVASMKAMKVFIRSNENKE